MDMNDTREDGKWGLEIAITGGQKPDWLHEDGVTEWLVNWRNAGWLRNPEKASYWSGITAIRLPADHPYYKLSVTRTTDEQLTHYAERCKALVEKMAGCCISDDWTDYREARAIVASMVEVDGDEKEVQQIIADDPSLNDANKDGWLYRAAHRSILAAIRRGRALERGE